jgi:hypothetical protein
MQRLLGHKQAPFRDKDNHDPERIQKQKYVD